jgi:hypothetical protein
MGFTMNPLQSLIHLGLGWFLLNAAYAGGRRALLASGQAAPLLAVLGLAGLLLLEGNPQLNLINTNRAMDLLHLASAGAAGLALAWKRRPAHFSETAA